MHVAFCRAGKIKFQHRVGCNRIGEIDLGPTVAGQMQRRTTVLDCHGTGMILQPAIAVDGVLVEIDRVLGSIRCNGRGNVQVELI